MVPGGNICGCVDFIVISQSLMKTVLNNMAYWALMIVWYALSLLPMWVHYVFSDILYVLVAHVLHYRHRVIWKNLTNAYPGKSEAELKRLQRQFYSHFCDVLVESVKFATMRRGNIKRRMTFKGVETMGEILDSGQSIALLLGHYGNWEWVTSLVLWLPPMRRDVAFGQIYHPLENNVFDRLMLKVRNRMGTACVSTRETLRWVITNESEGRPTMLGYINDQVPTWHNIHHWLTFLNQETPVFTGIERIARSRNQAVVYLDVKRVSRGHYECELQVITRDPAAMGQYELTGIYFQRMEQTINRAPQYWLWSHNRWKRTREEFDRRYQVVNGRVVEKSADS